MSESLHDYCLKNGMEQLLEQWDCNRNAGIDPAGIPYGSNKRVWWACPKGHKWKTSVKSRTNGTGCPVCAGKLVVAGENDLASVNPDLARQWHPVKNGGLRPGDVTAGSHRRVWWICGNGHEWQAPVASRASGCGCPVCAGKTVLPGENDLESLCPEIAAQWHREKNGKLTPRGVTRSSNRKVWWICGKGHEYQAVVSARAVHGSGCPYCSGRRVLAGFNDLATVEPEIAAQWHPDLNGGLTPEMVTRGSRKNVWWQCPLGHTWRAVVYSRTAKNASGCPVCAGKVQAKRLERYASACRGPSERRSIENRM